MSIAPSVSAISSWFGSNRMLAPHVGRALAQCSWVGVVFAGGMAEVPHIGARSLFINDMHSHVINLARVAADPILGVKLYRAVRRIPYSAASLEEAQMRCAAREFGPSAEEIELFATAHEPRSAFDAAEDNLQWAVDYFVCSWMARHSESGKRNEFDVGIGLRFDGGGGDNATHYWNAAGSLVTWRRILQRANFTTLDFREFLRKCCKDKPDTGIYCDPPFPGPGEGYKHPFAAQDHADLADRLSRYTAATVVCRYYDVPLIRDLYAGDGWHWKTLVGRKQSNKPADEVLISNKPFATGGPA